MWIDPLGLNQFNRITGQTVQRATDLSTNGSSERKKKEERRKKERKED